LQGYSRLRDRIDEFLVFTGVERRRGYEMCLEVFYAVRSPLRILTFE
jgi:hypothetical protein